MERNSVDIQVIRCSLRQVEISTCKQGFECCPLIGMEGVEKAAGIEEIRMKRKNQKSQGGILSMSVDSGGMEKERVPRRAGRPSKHVPVLKKCLLYKAK